MTLELTYIGHSAFHIQNEQIGILIDPFMTQNPLAKFDFNGKKLNYILVTHGHTDHVGDTVQISSKSGAKVIAVFELADILSKQGAKAIGLNLGGKVNLEACSITFLPAFHTSSMDNGQYAGEPASILLEIEGYKIYHAGDTSLTYEFKMVNEVYQPDIAILPIGGFFTMGIDEAVIGAKWLGAKTIIPMHYNTFDLVKADPQNFKSKIEAQGQDCNILVPGQTINL